MRSEEMNSGKELDQVEEIIRDGILKNVTNLLEVLKKESMLDKDSFAKDDVEQLKESCDNGIQELSRDIEHCSNEYFKAVSDVANHVISKISQVQKQQSVQLSNFKLRKELEILTEQEAFLLQLQRESNQVGYQE